MLPRESIITSTKEDYFYQSKKKKDEMKDYVETSLITMIKKDVGET